MKKHRFVLVCSNGCSHDLAGEDEFIPYGLTAQKRFDLPELLRKGWLPVRETPLGGSGNSFVAFALVLLEKDVSEKDVPEVKPA